MTFRAQMPNLSGPQNVFYLTDGGLETTLIYREGIELPHFAAFILLRDLEGRAALERYYRHFCAIALRSRCPIVLESPTWRANKDWAQKLGYDGTALSAANRQAVELMRAIQAEHEREGGDALISGNIGPRGDGYKSEHMMSSQEANEYHAEQVSVLADSGVDFVSAFTMNYAEEAIGIVEAAKQHHVPVVISFTVEVDGKLPSGETLGHAIEYTDRQTGGYVSYFMINCAHPDHFYGHLEQPWARRIGGIRANASRLSHAELDCCTELDTGDIAEFGQLHHHIRQQMPWINVMGGCCGTDERHVAAIVETHAGVDR